MAKVTIHVGIDAQQVATQLAALDAQLKEKKAEVTVIAKTDMAKRQYNDLLLSLKAELETLQRQAYAVFAGKGDAEQWSKYAVEKVNEIEDAVQKLQNKVANIGKSGTEGLKGIASTVSDTTKELNKATKSAENFASAMGKVATATNAVKSAASGSQTAQGQYQQFYSAIKSLSTGKNSSAIIQGNVPYLTSLVGNDVMDAYNIATNAAFVKSLYNGIMNPQFNGLYNANRAYANARLMLPSADSHVINQTYASAQQFGNASTQAGFGNWHIGTGGTSPAWTYSYKKQDVIYVRPDGTVVNDPYAYSPTRLALPSPARVAPSFNSEEYEAKYGWRNSYSGERGKLGNDIVDWDKYNQNVTEAAKNTSFFESVLGTSLGKYILRLSTYQMVSSGIYGTVEAFREATDTMKEVDTQLASIQKVTDFDAEQMEKIESSAYSVASKYGVEAQEYLESVSAFAKAGYKELADDLGELAIKTQLVGDVTASTANQFLLSVDAAWKMNGSVSELSTVLDEANVVENNYATSIDKLAQGMPNVASVASMAGMSAEQTIAALGTITAVTQQSGTKAATALRALILNIMKDTTTEVEEGVTVTKEQISTLDEVLQVYAKDAINAANATGKIVNPMEVVAALAEAYRRNAISDRDLAKIEMALGGKLRTNQLDALLKNYDKVYGGMMDKIAESAGSADKEIDVMLDTWDAKANILKNTWTEFISKTISTDMFKGVLDAATKLLNIVGDLGTALKAIGGIFAAKFAFDIPSHIGKIGKAFKSLIETLQTVRLLMKEDGAGFFDVLFSGSSSKKIGAGLSAAVIAYTAINIALNKYRDSIHNIVETRTEEAKKSAESASHIYELVKAYEAAQDGAGDAEGAAKRLANALGIEKDAVDSLKDSYLELAGAKIDKAISDAEIAKTAAENDIEYATNPVGGFGGFLTGLFLKDARETKTIRLSELSTQKEEYSEIMSIIRDGLADVSEIEKSNLPFSIERLMPKSNEASDIIAFYKALSDVAEDVDNALVKLDDDSGELRKEFMKSGTYSDIQDTLKFYQPYYEKFREAELVGVEQRLKKISLGGNADLIARPLVDAAELVKAGWKEAGDGIATVYTSTFSNESETKFGNFTPIMKNMDGTTTILTPKALQEYAEGVLNGVRKDSLNLQIGADFTSVDEAIDTAEELHELQATYFEDAIKAIESGEAVSDIVDGYADSVNKAVEAFNKERDAIDGATNALERYKKAMSSGEGGKGEKDDNFKTLSGAFDTLQKEAKGKRYASNAFQESARLVFGENYVAEKGIDHTVKRMKELQAMGVFDKDSAGKGLFNLISKDDDAKKTADGWYEIANGLAAVKKNADGTFEFNITDDVGELEQVASLLEVSAESLVIMQQAAGVFDGTIDVDALETLLNKLEEARKKAEETKQNTEEAKNNAEEAKKNAEEAKKNAEEVKESTGDTGSKTSTEGGEKEPATVSVETEGVEEAKSELDSVKETAKGVDEQTPKVVVTADVAGAMTSLAAVGQRVNNLPSSKTITINIVVNGELPDIGGNAEGTSNFKGGLTWVNEQKGGFNPELIETGGKSFFVNGGKPALVALPKGAVIYNATETRKLLADGSDITEVMHHDGGTLPLPERSGRIAGIGNGKGNGSSASSSDWWEKLQEYMEDLLEKAGDALDEQLEAIEAELFYLQYGKEVSEKATELEQARMDLLEAEQELINAQTERTVRYFNAETGQWEWMADQKDILKAQEELAERQKDYLQAQYDYLENVWNELKDDIQKAIDGKKDVDIASVLKQMLKSKAGGLTGNVEGLIGDLLNLITAFSNGTALDSYDSGGIANGLGYMFKATKADEVVLNGKLSNAILSPKRSQQFADFTSSLERMFGMSSMMERPRSMAGFSTTDSHNNIVYMNGIKIGSDMLNKPLSEVLSVLPIYCN